MRRIGQEARRFPAATFSTIVSSWSSTDAEIILGSATCTAVVFLVGGLDAAAAAGNILITSSGTNNADMLYNYSQLGVQLSAVAIPNSPKGYDQPHDLVVDKAGNTQVVYGGPYLATYNGSTWTYRTALNYSTFGVTYTGAIATYNQYVYVQSQNSGGSGNGIIRFDTANNYSTTFTQISDGRGGNYEPQDVTTGMDGGLYANFYIGGSVGHRVVEFNPDTMAIIKSVNLTLGNDDGDHTVVDEQGNIYAMGFGYLNKYASNGTWIKQIALTGHGDLAISSDDKLLTTQNATAYVFDTNLNQLDSAAVHSAYWGEPFVAWDTYQTPVGSVSPEPSCLALLALGGMALARRRRASSHRS